MSIRGPDGSSAVMVISPGQARRFGFFSCMAWRAMLVGFNPVHQAYALRGATGFDRLAAPAEVTGRVRTRVQA
jgi:hypothetical protein